MSVTQIYQVGMIEEKKDWIAKDSKRKIIINGHKGIRHKIRVNIKKEKGVISVVRCLFNQSSSGGLPDITSSMLESRWPMSSIEAKRES